MPKKPLDPNLILEGTPAPPAEPSAWDALGGWPGATAAGVRGLSGLLSPSGGPLGAVTSGGGEGIAQLLEYLGGINPEMTLPQRLGRVGVEAGVGAIPFGQVAKKGQLLRNILRGGALSGVGEAARESELLGGQGINPASVGLAAGIGGGTVAGMQGLTDLLMGTGKIAPKVAPEIVPTSQTARAPRPPRPTGPRERVSTEVPYRAETLEAPAAPASRGLITPEELAADLARVEAQGADVAGVPYNIPTGPSQRAALGEQKAWEQEARNLNVAEKKAAELTRAEQLEAELAASGLEPQTTFTDVVSAPTAAGGKATKTTRYTPPKEEDDTSALASTLGVDPSTITPTGGRRAFVPSPDPIADIAPAPEVADELGQIANFFKSRVDAAGAGYRGAKAAGDVPKDVLGRVHGRALQREGQEAGLPPRGPVPAEAPAQITPQVPGPGAGEVGPEWVQKELGVVERIKQLMRDQSSGKFGGESGLVHPEIATHLASAALGGLLGATTDPFGNPLLSGATGALAGGLLPSGINIARQGVGALGDVVEKGRESFSNLPDAGETILQAVEKIPNFQRANLLASIPGLIANAGIGPWGSAVTGALEKGLSGDARGWDALREVWNPVKFGRNMWQNRGEALDLLRKGELGRDENINPGVGSDFVDTLTAGPGVAMTAGDVTARRGLQAAGFGEDEARKMTLTSEPEWGFTRWLAHTPSGSGSVGDRLTKVAQQMMFPFRRTPANIVERGFERLPGVGALIQGSQGATGREIAVQQAMGLGAGGAGYLAGENIDDPTASREARRVVSNVAGQYSLPASLGFALGRSKNEALPKQRPGTITNELFPLPAAENLTKFGNMLFGEGGESKLPRGLVPAVLREPIPFLQSEPLISLEDEPDTIPQLPTFRRR